VGDEIITTRNDRGLLTTASGWVRNGDRWHVRARHPDGSLAVDDAAGRGRLTLPAGYVTDHVTLAYAVTVHKAQGVTVDRAVVVADDSLSAEALYVGMTRGRRSNTALVITDALHSDHTPFKPMSARDVLVSALQRVASEQSAIDTLRHSLAASESLAVLKPRLANIDAQVAQYCPPDHTGELEALAIRRAHIERHARPGRLTRAGRDDRRRLDALDECRHELEAAQQRRDEWRADHADTLRYRDEIAGQVVARGTALGVTAAVDQPGHLLHLLGRPPDDEPGRARWTQLAGQVEAYREEWNVEPAQLHARPLDSTQHRQWETVTATIEAESRLAATNCDQGFDRGLGIEL